MEGIAIVVLIAAFLPFLISLGGRGGVWKFLSLLFCCFSIVGAAPIVGIGGGILSSLRFAREPVDEFLRKPGIGLRAFLWRQPLGSKLPQVDASMVYFLDRIAETSHITQVLFHRGYRPTATGEQGAEADTTVEVNHQLSIRERAQIRIAPISELPGFVSRHLGRNVDEALKSVGLA